MLLFYTPKLLLENLSCYHFTDISIRYFTYEEKYRLQNISTFLKCKKS